MRLKAKNLIILSIISFLFIVSSVFAYEILIPERLYIMAGHEHEFNYSIPIRARVVENESIGVMSVNDEVVDGNIEISLAKPFTVKLSEDGVASVDLMLGKIPLKTVEVCILPDIKVIPSGNTVGVTLKTTGVLVLGTGAVNDSENNEIEPAKGILQSGDLIIEADGISLEKKEDLISAVDAKNGEVINLTIKRDGEVKKVDVTPAKSNTDESYKLGVWVRDSTQGIGTVTYYNPNDNSFGALGHGVYDVDTRQLMSLKEGKITKSHITGIKKGEKGSPGELMGNIEKDYILGEIVKNTEYGLYGKIDPNSSSFFNGEALPIATKNQVVEGPAEIITTLDNNTTERYKVEIESVNKYSQSADKGMVVRITDERLLNKTNGIVQGMSGSPIIQNGKLIGAVTHVFVREPQKGYGIFIENMLSQ